MVQLQEDHARHLAKSSSRIKRGTMQTDEHGQYFGCIVGRVANRIEGAAFRDPEASSRDNAEEFELEANDAPHALHGGSKHWGRQQWKIEVKTPVEVTFRLESPDGDGGYPGQADVRVTYELEQPDRSEYAKGLQGGVAMVALRVTMEAKVSKRTPVNMVQHTHWNLAGQRAVQEVRQAEVLLLRRWC